MRKTRQQETAQMAWNFVNEAQKDVGVNFGEYQQLLQGAGSTILSVGLGQTVAFYFSQSKKHYHKILRQWASFLGLDNERALVEALMKNSTTYRDYTTRVLALLDWMKRFSKGLEKTDG